MLHKYIEKVLKTSKKPIEISNFPSNELYFQIFEPRIDKIDSSHSLSEKLEFPSNKSPLTKKHSIFKTKYSQDNKVFSLEILEKKNERIKKLEKNLKEISALLYDLSVKIKEALKLEKVFHKKTDFSFNFMYFF